MCHKWQNGDIIYDMTSYVMNYYSDMSFLHFCQLKLEKIAHKKILSENIRNSCVMQYGSSNVEIRV